MRRRACAAVLVGALAAPALPAAAQTLASVAITLAPAPGARGGATIETVEVTLRFDGVTTAAGAVLVRLPLVVSNVDTVATVLTDLRATDTLGPVAITSRDVDLPTEAARDAEAGGRSREWIAARATKGPVTIRYTVPAHATLPPRGPAPPFAFSNDGEGVSAAGTMFLAMPPSSCDRRATMAWDLAALPPGARGVSSLGAGRVVARGSVTAAQLRSSYYMAGRIGTAPTPIPATGFFAAWQGSPAFDARALTAWTGTLYDRYARFFGQATPPPYGVFLRYNPINAGGGVGLNHSFVATFGKGEGSNVAKLQSTLAHEMFHTFQPYVTQPAGLESSWFGEGLATLYQRRLPLRFGRMTPAAFLDDLNMHAARYYTSIMATAPNSDVPKRFWADTRIRTLPYDRGMLYFATVDDRVRKRSAGKRSLDDLMFAMLALDTSARDKGASDRTGRPITNADWEAVLARELGEPAVTEFRAFLGGRMPLPASDAFGPCFARTTARLRRYDLGFDTAVLAEPTRIVRGLVAGSAADEAGLRDGDAIVDPVPQDGIQGNQTQMIELSIRRGGKVFPVRYLPRGETVDAYQWRRVAGVPDTACAL